MIYDAVKPRAQTWMRIVGNGLLLFAFAAALYPFMGICHFMSYKHSDALKISIDGGILSFCCISRGYFDSARD